MSILYIFLLGIDGSSLPVKLYVDRTYNILVISSLEVFHERKLLEGHAKFTLELRWSRDLHLRSLYNRIVIVLTGYTIKLVELKDKILKLLEKMVEFRYAVVRQKLTSKIDLEKLIEQEVEERFALH